MSINVIYSQEKDIGSIKGDLENKAQSFLENNKVQLVLFFSTSNIDPAGISSAVKELFQDADVFGCTTAGEICSGHMLKDSVVVMMFDDEVIEDSKIEMIKGIKEGKTVEEAFSNFEAHYNTSMKTMDMHKHVGIILTDGMCGAEERLMEKIGDLTDVQFIGAAAGDDLKFKETFVFANGKADSNTAVLALLKTKNGFDILKTQSFKSLDKKLVATKVDEAAREVIEFNNKPAAIAYSEALGVSKEEATNHFMSHPVGLMISGEPYVRSPQQFVGDNMKFYCNIKQDMEMVLLESTDIVVDTKKDVQNKINQTGQVIGIINFHCILRTLELDNKNQSDDYGKIFSDIPTIGFSTYGEEYIGHINQTSTMLFFK